MCLALESPMQSLKDLFDQGAELYADRQWDKSLEVAKELKEYAQEAKNAPYQIQAYHLLGKIYNRKNHTENP